MKIACGFGAGMGYTGQTCGAVTEALMLIGLKHGKYLPEDNASKQKTYELVQAFIHRFEAIYGTVNCTELLDCDLRTEAGVQIAIKKGLFKTKCAELVRGAAEIVEDVLEL